MKKGRKIFVTYGNEGYYKSLERIREEAEASGRFDEIRVYTDKDLPDSVTEHELFKHKRGGGYWFWKPWVILDAMKDMDEDDILIYSDAGSRIYGHKEWDRWFDVMSGKSALFFFYSGLVETWTRRGIIEHFHDIKGFHKFFQLVAGLFLLRKSSLYLIREWYELMRDHPELVMDVDKDMMKYESPVFVENRHDQSILTGVVYSHMSDKRIKLMYQSCEIQHPGGQAVFTARLSDNEQRNNTSVFPWHLELIRRYYVTPMTYLRLNMLKIRNTTFFRKK